MLNIRGHVDLTVHNTNIWRNILIKFSKQIGNSFPKIIKTKVNPKPCQTSEMRLFPQAVTGFRSELRILPTSKMELFAKIIKNEKLFNIFAKIFIFDV